MRWYALCLCLLCISFGGSASALTLTVGGNMEDTALQTDQMTADMCSSIYSCGSVRYVSFKGKSGQVNAGVFTNDHLKAGYASKANKSKYSQFTEKASWAERPFKDETALTGAFSAVWVNDQIAEKTSEAPLALAGDTAPAAEQALFITENAGYVDNLRSTEMYSSAETAAKANSTNHAEVFTGSNLLDKANTAIKGLGNADNYTSY